MVDTARYFGALLLTLALLGGFLVALRRFGPRLGLAPGGGARLAVTDAVMLDARRRLVVVRDARAGREHVILLGPSGEQVVESREAAPELGLQAANKPLSVITGGAP